MSEPVDWQHIAEEIEDVGTSERHTVESHLVRAMADLLKAEMWPRALAGSKRRKEARMQRGEARRRYSPGMRQRIDLPALYREAVGNLPERTYGLRGRPAPPQYPWSLDWLLDIERA